MKSRELQRLINLNDSIIGELDYKDVIKHKDALYNHFKDQFNCEPVVMACSSWDNVIIVPETEIRDMAVRFEMWNQNETGKKTKVEEWISVVSKDFRRFSELM